MLIIVRAAEDPEGDACKFAEMIIVFSAFIPNADSLISSEPQESLDIDYRSSTGYPR